MTCYVERWLVFERLGGECRDLGQQIAQHNLWMLIAFLAFVLVLAYACMVAVEWMRNPDDL